MYPQLVDYTIREWSTVALITLIKGMILTGQMRLRFGSLWFHFGGMRGQNHYVSLRFNMASVDIKNFENKYDYPDNYELQQHRRSSVVVEWYKKCITTASSTVLLGITRAYI